MDKKTLIIVCAVLIALIAVAGIAYGVLLNGNTPDILPDLTPDSTSGSDSGETTDASESMLAPDFTVYDADGNAVKLSDHFGKPIVLNFWASWCGPCKSEMPEFDAAWEKYYGEIVFLMVNMTDGQRETVDVAREFVADEGYSFPVLYDTKSDAANTYGVYSLPTTCFIDADGNFVTYAIGAIDGNLLEKGIGMIK